MPRVDATETKALSCTACRNSKVRCEAKDDVAACTRCSRKRINCTREQSKRRFTPVQHQSSTSWQSANRASAPLSHRVNAGLPSLSNPLKLLAQASDEVEEESIFSFSQQQQRALRVAQTVETSDISKWKSSFSAGLYAPRHEGMIHDNFDPIECQIVGFSRAASLFHAYMDQYNDGNVLLDPQWHTFEYVKKHNLLSSVIYLVVARQEAFEGAREMSNQLDDLIRKRLVPEILHQGYRSVEIVLGMIILATFDFSSQYIFDDQSWIYLGHAIRIGTELDINSRIVSKALCDQDEGVIHQYRAQERAWMGVYLTQEYFCLQTGRKAFINTDGVIDECQDWRLAPSSAQEDVFVIAHIQLRRIYNVYRGLFNRLCNMQYDTGLNKGNLLYFISRVQEELSTWYNRFKDADATSLRAIRIRLLLNHCKVMLFSMPLQDIKCGLTSLDIAMPAIVHLYEATTAYLDDLTGLMPLHRLGRGHNSIFINGSYVAVMALKLSTLCDKIQWINADQLFVLVEETSLRFSKEWRGPKQRKASSQAYSEYLHWLLDRYKRQRTSLSSSAAAASPRDPSRALPMHTNNSQHASYPFLSSTSAQSLDPSSNDLWGDGTLFFEDTDFLSWAQKYLDEQ